MPDDLLHCWALGAITAMPIEEAAFLLDELASFCGERGLITRPWRGAGDTRRSGPNSATYCRSLTLFSQTDRTTPDQSGWSGHPADADLPIWILAHWSDTWH